MSVLFDFFKAYTLKPVLSVGGGVGFAVVMFGGSGLGKRFLLHFASHLEWNQKGYFEYLGAVCAGPEQGCSSHDMAI